VNSDIIFREQKRVGEFLFSNQTHNRDQYSSNTSTKYTFGIDESADMEEDMNTPVYKGYHKKDKFNGKIQKVVVETFPGK
jgi:hypothetical protein